MTEARLTSAQALLLSCAVLPWFDEQLLRTVYADEPHLIGELLASDLVVPVGSPAHAFSLREDAQTQALDWAKARSDFDELAIHTRAFDAFLQRLHARADDQSHALFETQCFYHLDKIFFLIISRGEWQTITRLIDRARSAVALSAQYQHLLSFYEASVATNIHQYDQAEAMFVALLHAPELATDLRMRVLNGIALVQMYQHAYDRALEYYQQVSTLAQALSDRFYQAVALANMSMIYNDLDYYEQALELSLRSLAIFRELDDRRREAVMLYEIGNTALHLGRWQIAEEHFDQAIRLCDEFGMHGRLANLYWAQGLLHHFLGHEATSEVAYLRALAISQSPDHGDQRVENDVLWHLGFLYSTQGLFDKALALYESAIAIAHNLHRAHWLSMMHFQLGNLFKRQGRLAEAFAAYAAAIDGIEALSGATASEEIKIGLLGTTQQIYEAMVLLCLALGRDSEAFDYVERARSRALLDALAKKSPELYATLAQPVATLAEVQAELPAGALLVEYFTMGVLPIGEHMINQLPASNARLRAHLSLPPATIIFAVTRDRLEVHRPALDPNHLRPPAGDRYPGRHLLHGRLPQHLHARLIEPIAHLLAGSELLYLIPHGPLHYVPFSALRSAAGTYLLRADGPALAHAPSATILLRNCLGRPRSAGVDALAIGFDDPHGDTPLRYAETEARHVARLLGGHAWTGPEPKSERLIAAGRQLRWLHIAGHARFHPHDPLASNLYLGAGDALSARTIIRDLDLAADLVTLSSCTSGVNRVVPGDELLGLQRALLYAGAPAVVCTRWEARDLVAMLVMDRFYTAMLNGLPPALALRDAQVAVRDMSLAELAAQLERWRAQAFTTGEQYDPAAPLHDALAATLEQLASQAIDPETRPFADPLLWAPFMLVGRA